MRTFKEFLLLLEMTKDEAYSILGISPNSDYDLKKAYRQASIIHHPDKGGTTEMMQKVNAAYQLLKNVTPDKNKKFDWDALDKKNKVKVDIVSKIFTNSIDIKRYIDYFEKFISPIHHIFKEQKFKDGVRHLHNFHTNGDTTVFDITLDCSVNNIDFTNSLGGTSGVTFNFYTDHYLYHDKRKQKMKKRTWGFKGSTLEIEDPSILFPKKTLEKIFSGQKQNTFKKSDMIEAFVKELKARVNQSGSKDVDAWKPITPDTNLLLFRSLFLKVATWGANGLYMKDGNYNGKRTNRLVFKSLPETEETINFLKHTISLMKNKKTRDEMAVVFNTEIEKYAKKLQMERK